MFDTYQIREGGAVPYEKTVTVTEKRAATDESVRLLREMEAAAREAVVCAYVTEPNELIHGAAVLFRETTGGQSLHIAFTLNGKQKQTSMTLPFRAYTPREVSAWFRKALADAILCELAVPILREIQR